jgi:hypothetical protein
MRAAVTQAMTSIHSADLAAVMGGCKRGQQQPQPQQDPSQGDPQQQQAAPQPQQGGMDWRGMLSGILGMVQQMLQPQQQ